jgi:integrase
MHGGLVRLEEDVGRQFVGGQPQRGGSLELAGVERHAEKWVSPHVFRKTVTTVLSGQGLVTEAAAHLGHVDESITKKYYIQKPSTAPDVNHALELLIRGGERP